ncbi:MAG: hypothetical protein EBT98_09775 [Opitutaceae bacterium]|jgi:hypothetical protein|nr:hypothetical protein [Opitutaceae bacterium]
MTEKIIDADKLVRVYIKMRDAKAHMVAEHDAKVLELEEKMALVEHELLDICKTTGQDGGKTAHGSFTRTVKTRYWTTDWDSMYRFIKDHDAVELLERRVAQLNMKTFLQENPGLLPEGLNVDSKYSITVRRATK